MVKTIKRHTTSKGNELQFYKTDLLGPGAIVVLDKSCQKERTYIIGQKKELDFYSGPVLIENLKQVVEAWVNEKIHF